MGHHHHPGQWLRQSELGCDFVDVMEEAVTRKTVVKLHLAGGEVIEGLVTDLVTHDGKNFVRMPGRAEFPLETVEALSNE